MKAKSPKMYDHELDMENLNDAVDRRINAIESRGSSDMNLNVAGSYRMGMGPNGLISSDISISNIQGRGSLSIPSEHRALGVKFVRLPSDVRPGSKEFMDVLHRYGYSAFMLSSIPAPVYTGMNQIGLMQHRIGSSFDTWAIFIIGDAARFIDIASLIDVQDGMILSRDVHRERGNLEWLTHLAFIDDGLYGRNSNGIINSRFWRPSWFRYVAVKLNKENVSVANVSSVMAKLVSESARYSLMARYEAQLSNMNDLICRPLRSGSVHVDILGDDTNRELLCSSHRSRSVVAFRRERRGNNMNVFESCRVRTIRRSAEDLFKVDSLHISTNIDGGALIGGTHNIYTSIIEAATEHGASVSFVRPTGGDRGAEVIRASSDVLTNILDGYSNFMKGKISSNNKDNIFDLNSMIGYGDVSEHTSNCIYNCLIYTQKCHGTRFSSLDSEWNGQYWIKPNIMRLAIAQTQVSYIRKEDVSLRRVKTPRYIDLSILPKLKISDIMKARVKLLSYRMSEMDSDLAKLASAGIVPAAPGRENHRPADLRSINSLVDYIKLPYDEILNKYRDIVNSETQSIYNF